MASAIGSLKSNPPKAGMEDMTLGEAAKAIGVSVDTLRRWDRLGRVRTHRDARNRRLFPQVADATASCLPRLAPSPGRDPRAPQNLLPIGALEGALRRRLGDARLVRRHIEALVAREIVHD